MAEKGLVMRVIRSALPSQGTKNGRGACGMAERGLENGCIVKER